MKSILVLFLAFVLTAFSVNAQRERGAIVTDITDCGSPSPSATGRLKAYAYIMLPMDKANNCWNVLIVITTEHPEFGEVAIGQGVTCIPKYSRTTMPSDLPTELKSVLNDCSYVKINKAVIRETTPPSVAKHRSRKSLP